MELQAYPNLYTKDAKGKTRFWRLERFGGSYRSVSGLVGGKETTSAYTVAIPKNVGRSNATTGEEQAIAEIEAEYKKKRDRKYYDEGEEVGGKKFYAPMLAEKFKDLPAGIVWAQPKLDGFRAIVTKDGITSRAGKPFFLTHIMEALERFFEVYPEVVLDGELYNHDLKADFEKLGSLIKKQTRSPEQEKEVADLMQYHVYDVPSVDGNYQDRHDFMKFGVYEYISDAGPIKLVETLQIEHQDDLDEAFGRWLELGYEGQMVRLDDFSYESGKRSKSLLKRKEFLDAEFEISGVFEGEGNWAGYAKVLEFILPGDHRLENGKRPRAGIKGTQEFTKDLLENWRQYKYATVEFFGYTKAGIPRFPVAAKWWTSLEEKI